jgi:hypothetical protein
MMRLGFPMLSLRLFAISACFAVQSSSFAILSTPAPATAPAAGASTPSPVQIRDIAPPVDVFPYPLWMVLTVAGVALVMLGLLVWLLVHWLKGRPAPPPPSPRSLALAELEKLRAEVPVMAPYAFSFAVSDVLRTFIGRQFGLHAREQTSPEFLAEISRAGRFSDSDRSLIAEFLSRCDMIKFARIDASSADSAKLLESAITFARGGSAKDLSVTPPPLVKGI